MGVVEGLKVAVADRTAAVEAALERALDGADPAELNAAARHLVAAGGRRLRPGVLVLAAKAVDPDDDPEGLLPTAVAVEMFQPCYWSATT